MATCHDGSKQPRTGLRVALSKLFTPLSIFTAPCKLAGNHAFLHILPCFRSTDGIIEAKHYPVFRSNSRLPNQGIASAMHGNPCQYLHPDSCKDGLFIATAPWLIAGFRAEQENSSGNGVGERQ
jgi:hypothetical protein